jgi:hypothetical protein
MKTSESGGDKGPKNGRVKYEILSNDVTKINFRESINIKTELREVYYSSSLGVPVSSGYEEIAVQVDKRILELNHFDLVSIHFYNDPSFIDLSADVSYVETHFFTFAGFIDYILEKESSKVAEDVFNAALFTISLAVGFGELVAAIRTINAARAICGLAMVTSDTALYLTTRVDFRNYIITTYGDTQGQEILSNMTILSTISSLGFNLTAGSGILKVYTREQGLKLVGTGEAILKDSNALSTMLPNEIVALEEAIKKIKNELYAVRNVPEAVQTITRTKATVFFYKFPQIKNELEILTETSRFKFFDDFGNISKEFVLEFDKTPDFIAHWDTLSDAQKLSVKLDKIGYYKTWYPIRTEAKALERFNLKIIDLDTNKPFRLPECRTWVDLQTQSKGLFEGLPYGKIGDVRGVSGNYNGISLSGKSIDFWGLPKGALLSNNYQGAQRAISIKRLLDSIDGHFVKFFSSTRFPGESLDIFIMDLRYYDQDLAIKNIVLNYINDPNYFYKNLRDNPSFFILINQ